MGFCNRPDVGRDLLDFLFIRDRIEQFIVLVFYSEIDVVYEWKHVKTPTFTILWVLHFPVLSFIVEVVYIFLRFV